MKGSNIIFIYFYILKTTNISFAAEADPRQQPQKTHKYTKVNRGGNKRYQDNRSLSSESSDTSAKSVKSLISSTLSKSLWTSKASVYEPMPNHVHTQCVIVNNTKEYQTLVAQNLPGKSSSSIDDDDLENLSNVSELDQKSPVNELTGEFLCTAVYKTKTRVIIRIVHINEDMSAEDDSNKYTPMTITIPIVSQLCGYFNVKEYGNIIRKYKTNEITSQISITVPVAYEIVDSCDFLKDDRKKSLKKKFDVVARYHNNYLPSSAIYGWFMPLARLIPFHKLDGNSKLPEHISKDKLNSEIYNMIVASLKMYQLVKDSETEKGKYFVNICFNSQSIIPMGQQDGVYDYKVDGISCMIPLGGNIDVGSAIMKSGHTMLHPSLGCKKKLDANKELSTVMVDIREFGLAEYVYMIMFEILEFIHPNLTIMVGNKKIKPRNTNEIECTDSEYKFEVKLKHFPPVEKYSLEFMMLELLNPKENDLKKFIARIEDKWPDNKKLHVTRKFSVSSTESDGSSSNSSVLSMVAKSRRVTKS